MPIAVALHLETYFLAFIDEVVASGRYSSPNQVVQAGLRLLEQSELPPDALATVLQEGEANGLAEDFDFDELLSRKNSAFDAAGRLPTPKETTLHLEVSFLAFIEEAVASGRFSSPTQVVQAGLRLLEERESHGKALRTAIQEGLDSGWVEDFNLDEFLAEMRKEATAKKVPDAA
jgi:antitoxin ParD1/3/4